MKTPPQKLAAFFDSFISEAAGWTEEECEFGKLAKLETIQMACQMASKTGTAYSLSILGATSAGKTMLAKLLRRFWNRGLAKEHAPVLNWPTHDWQTLEAEKHCPCIVIDEVGRGGRGERGKNGGEWSRFLDFFNFRQERRLWTVITSNMTWDEIRAIDPAIASRMRRNGGIVLQAGANVRPFEDRKP